MVLVRYEFDQILKFQLAANIERYLPDLLVEGPWLPTTMRAALRLAVILKPKSNDVLCSDLLADFTIFQDYHASGILKTNQMRSSISFQRHNKSLFEMLSISEVAKSQKEEDE